MTKLLEKQIEKFHNSLFRLKEVLKRDTAEDDIILDATIQRFEFTFENGWKAIKHWLKQKGVECLTPRDCIKEAFKLGLITEEEGYLTLLECRNLTSHTYNLATAEEVYKSIKDNINLFDSLSNKLKVAAQ